MVKTFAPASVSEALDILNNNSVTIYAGGTDLMVSNQADTPFMFIGKIPELKKVYDDEEYIYIGSAVTFAEGLENEMVPALMREAISHIASPAIRNVGTFGGNICNGAGKADSVVVDFVFDAKLKLESVQGTRIVDVASFCKGRKLVDLCPNELLTYIMLPKRKMDYKYYFEKVSTRNALAISNISFAAMWKMDGGVLNDIAIGIGAAGDTVMRCGDIEQLMIGNTGDEVREKSQKLIDAFKERMYFPLDRTSINYRKIVCSNLIELILT